MDWPYIRNIKSCHDVTSMTRRETSDNKLPRQKARHSFLSTPWRETSETAGTRGNMTPYHRGASHWVERGEERGGKRRSEKQTEVESREEREREREREEERDGERWREEEKGQRRREQERVRWRDGEREKGGERRRNRRTEKRREKGREGTTDMSARCLHRCVGRLLLALPRGRLTASLTASQGCGQFLYGVFDFVCNRGNHRDYKQEAARVKILGSFKSHTFSIFTLAVSCLGQTSSTCILVTAFKMEPPI